SRLDARGTPRRNTRSSSCRGRPIRAVVRSYDLQLPPVVAVERGRGGDAPHDDFRAGVPIDETDVGFRRHTLAHARVPDRVEERAAVAARQLETRFAEARAARRAWRHPDRVDATHAAALVSCCCARSANFAKRLKNASFCMPTGPFLCFARMTSASPLSSDSSL